MSDQPVGEVPDIPPGCIASSYRRLDRRLDRLREDNVALQAKLDVAMAILGAM